MRKSVFLRGRGNGKLDDRKKAFNGFFHILYADTGIIDDDGVTIMRVRISVVLT